MQVFVGVVFLIATPLWLVMRFHVLLLTRSITRPKARSNRNSPVTIQRPVRKVNEIVIKASSLVKEYYYF